MLQISNSSNLILFTEQIHVKIFQKNNTGIRLVIKFHIYTEYYNTCSVSMFKCDTSCIVKNLRLEVAQVSWRCAARRPSARLNGVFLKSERKEAFSDKLVVWKYQLCSAYVQNSPTWFLLTCDDVLQSSVLPLAHLRLHLPLLQLCYQVHLRHLRHHRRLANVKNNASS